MEQVPSRFVKISLLEAKIVYVIKYIDTAHVCHRCKVLIGWCCARHYVISSVGTWRAASCAPTTPPPPTSAARHGKAERATARPPTARSV